MWMRAAAGTLCNADGNMVESMPAQEPVFITCPESGERLLAARAWKSSLPNGQPILYAQFRLHHHCGKECLWSYMVLAVKAR